MPSVAAAAATKLGDFSAPVPGGLSTSGRSTASSSASSASANATPNAAVPNAAGVARAVSTAGTGGGAGGGPVFMSQPSPPFDVESVLQQRRVGSLPPRSGDAWGAGHDSTRPAAWTAVEIGGGGSIGLEDNSLNPWRESVNSQVFHSQRGGGGSAFQVEVGGGGGLESGSGRGGHPAVGVGPRVAGR